jgi:hypothetical protein
MMVFITPHGNVQHTVAMDSTGQQRAAQDSIMQPRAVQYSIAQAGRAAQGSTGQ